jgi:hypothetical protein
VKPQPSAIYIKGGMGIMNATAALIGFFGVIIAMLCAVGAAYYSQRKPEIDDNQLEFLEEVAREHELGIADNRKRLMWLIHLVENKYEVSVAQAARLDRVRGILRHVQG